MGIPSITTNLSGFGSFMQDLIEKPEVRFKAWRTGRAAESCFKISGRRMLYR